MLLHSCPAVHGVASWFDVLFDGTQTQRWLSTAPGLPITHWWAAAPRCGCTVMCRASHDVPLTSPENCLAAERLPPCQAHHPNRRLPAPPPAHGSRFQLRCLMEQPVMVTQPGATVSGELRLEAHNRQSYDVLVTLRAPPLASGGPEQASDSRSGRGVRGGAGGGACCC